MMIFVDGENLAIRYRSLLGGEKPADHVSFEKDVYVWSEILNKAAHHNVEIVRTYYFTSAPGDEARLRLLEDNLGRLGIEAPRVFKKSRGRGSKRVDIALAVEVLSHAHRRNYDVAVLVAGDADYVPLIEAVIREGRRAFVWFVAEGLSQDLVRASAYFFDITPVLLQDTASGAWSAAFH